MTAIKKTSTKITSNLGFNEAHIYVTRPTNPRKSYVTWKEGTYGEWHWSKYQIKETDMRTKTATFSSPNYIDPTTGLYCVLISSPMHEDFGGVILSVEYDKNSGVYDYQCQDYSRFYQSQFELITNAKTTIHRVLQCLVSRGGVSAFGKVSKKQLNEYKDELSGLRPAYQYDQKYWRYTTKMVNKINKMSSKKQKQYTFNPMTDKPLMIIRNKSFIEAIRDIVYGSGAYIDVYFNKYGVLKIEPYFITDLFQTGLHLTTPEVASAKYKFDTTNIITGVTITGDKLDVGSYKTSKQLVNLDLSAFFGTLVTSVKGDTDNNTDKKGSSKDSKKSTSTNKTDNPYNTKKKEVEISSDNINGKSKDKARLNSIAKILKKNGWKVTNHGVGSNMHSEKHLKIKNGVHFCLMGGVDAGMIREVSINSSYVKKQKKLNSRTVWAWVGPNNHCGDIRKGGNRYKYMPRAHDDNYSPTSFKGISYPSKKLINAKVPFMYGKTADEIASKFLAGGDEVKAL